MPNANRSALIYGYFYLPDKRACPESHALLVNPHFLVPVIRSRYRFAHFPLIFHILSKVQPEVLVSVPVPILEREIHTHIRPAVPGVEIPEIAFVHSLAVELDACHLGALVNEQSDRVLLLHWVFSLDCLFQLAVVYAQIKLVPVFLLELIKGFVLYEQVGLQWDLFEASA